MMEPENKPERPEPIKPGHMTAWNRRQQTARNVNKKRRERLESGEPGFKLEPRKYKPGEAF